MSPTRYLYGQCGFVMNYQSLPKRMALKCMVPRPLDDKNKRNLGATSSRNDSFGFSDMILCSDYCFLSGTGPHFPPCICKNEASVAVYLIIKFSMSNNFNFVWLAPIVILCYEFPDSLFTSSFMHSFNTY